VSVVQVWCVAVQLQQMQHIFLPLPTSEGKTQICEDQFEPVASPPAAEQRDISSHSFVLWVQISIFRGFEIFPDAGEEARV